MTINFFGAVLPLKCFVVLGCSVTTVWNVVGTKSIFRQMSHSGPEGGRSCYLKEKQKSVRIGVFVGCRSTRVALVCRAFLTFKISASDS